MERRNKRERREERGDIRELGGRSGEKKRGEEEGVGREQLADEARVN